MIDLPSGTVTFLFTDIEGSAKVAQAHPTEWEVARGRHHAILHDAIGAHHGVVFQMAAVLLGADTHRQSIKTRLSSNLRADNDRNVAAARAQLGDVSFEAQFAAGHKLTLEQAIALALADEPW